MQTRQNFSVLRLLAIGVLLLSSFGLAGSSGKERYPDIIPLPNGFRPEGIVTGRGATFFVGSIPSGAIYRGSYASGEGAVFVAGREGRSAIGLSYDRRSKLLFVAGGPTGMAFVYDAESGADVAAIQLTTEPATFINDVVVTKEAAYFTDSSQPVLYKVPLHKNGRLPDPPASETIPLGGDFEFVPGAFNSNGIDATPNGKQLVIVSSALGALYRVDPQTGEAALIDLGGGAVSNGDGILLHGKSLYVVQNFLNQVAVVRLDKDLASGAIVETIADPNFRIPTTIARFGGRLYVVNARFDTPPSADTEYEVVRARR